jgi:hypothetical protein
MWGYSAFRPPGATADKDTNTIVYPGRCYLPDGIVAERRTKSCEFIRRRAILPIQCQRFGHSCNGCIIWIISFAYS